METTNRQTLLGEIIAIYFANRTKHVNVLWEQKPELLILKYVLYKVTLEFQMVKGQAINAFSVDVT
jgi:hypothetical protein